MSDDCNYIEPGNEKPNTILRKRRVLVTAALTFVVVVGLLYLQRCAVLTNMGVKFSVVRLWQLNKIESRNGSHLWTMPLTKELQSEVSAKNVWRKRPGWFATGEELIVERCPDIDHVGGFYTNREWWDSVLPAIYIGCDKVYILYHQGVGSGG